MKLHLKFSPLNVDFDSPSFDFLGPRTPAHEGIKYWYPRKSRYFTVVGQSFARMVADRHGHCHVLGGGDICELGNTSKQFSKNDELKTDREVIHKSFFSYKIMMHK